MEIFECFKLVQTYVTICCSKASETHFRRIISESVELHHQTNEEKPIEAIGSRSVAQLFKTHVFINSFEIFLKNYALKKGPQQGLELQLSVEETKRNGEKTTRYLFEETTDFQFIKEDGAYKICKIHMKVKKTFLKDHPLAENISAFQQETDERIDSINNHFYNNSGSAFDKIPFIPLLPDLLMTYVKGPEIFEIGCGAGALAQWLMEKGYQVSCLEPAQELAIKALEKGLKVYPLTFQQFHSSHPFDTIVAISSLIHVPKAELPSQIQKISKFLKAKGIFVVSFIEGKDEGFEDPSHRGKMRYFAKWTVEELDSLFSSEFDLLESHKIPVDAMNRTFILRVYALK